MARGGREKRTVGSVPCSAETSRTRTTVIHAGIARGMTEMIHHIERYWCPTVTSDELAGGVPFQLPETA